MWRGIGLCRREKSKDLDPGKALLDSWELINKQQYKKAEALLGKVLEKDPGNPLALNNLAACMVAEKKFDKADTYLNQALPKAKGYMVQVNRVCTVGNICSAFKPVAGCDWQPGSRASDQDEHRNGQRLHGSGPCAWQGPEA